MTSDKELYAKLYPLGEGTKRKRMIVFSRCDYILVLVLLKARMSFQIDQREDCN